jgi:hypothetical protein
MALGDCPPSLYPFFMRLSKTFDVTRLRILSLPFLNFERLNPEFSPVISTFCSGLFQGESYLSWISIAFGEVLSLGENFSDFLVREFIRVR